MLLALIVGNPQKNRIRRLIRRTILAMVLSTAALLLSHSAFVRWTTSQAPADEGPALDSNLRLEERGDGLELSTEGAVSWHDADLLHLELAGSPRQMGHGHGVLLGHLHGAVVRSSSGSPSVNGHSWWPRLLSSNAKAWQQRNLADYLAPRFLAELALFSKNAAGVGDSSSSFSDSLTWHAQLSGYGPLDEDRRLRSNAIAVWGKASVAGHIIVGRSLSVDRSAGLAKQKTVFVYRPKGKEAFITVGWPGFVGAFWGVNAQRIFVSSHAIRTDNSDSVGTPRAFFVRNILEEAKSLAEAIEWAKKEEGRLPAALLVIDGKTGEAAVLEFTNNRLFVRKPKSNTLVVTNHLLHPKFSKDGRNDQVRRHTSSGLRHQRLTQLAKRFSGRIDRSTMALMLRNRTALDDEPLPLGHRAAVDALDAIDGTVVDLTDFVLWVAKGPHLVGGFEPFDLRYLLQGADTMRGDLQEIAAEPLLNSLPWRSIVRCRQAMAFARSRVKSGNVAVGYRFAQRALLFAEEYPRAHLLAGDLAWQLDRRAEAARHYRYFLSTNPSDQDERLRAKGRSE